MKTKSIFVAAVALLALVLSACAGPTTINQEAQLLALQFKLDPITCALNGGEDYELLCTVPAERVGEALALGVRLGVALTKVGTVTDRGAGLQLRSGNGEVRPLRVSAW